MAYLEELVQIPEVSETESEIQQNISMDNADMSPKDNFRTPTKESTLPLESTTNPTVINILENKQKDPVVEPRYSFSKKVYMRQPESASTIGSSVSIAMHKTIDKPRATIGSPLNQGTPVKESKATPLSYSVNLASPIKPGNERNNENARTLNSQTSQSSQKQLSNSRKLLNRPKITMRA